MERHRVSRLRFEVTAATPYVFLMRYRSACKQPHRYFRMFKIMFAFFSALTPPSAFVIWLLYLNAYGCSVHLWVISTAFMCMQYLPVDAARATRGSACPASPPLPVFPAKDSQYTLGMLPRPFLFASLLFRLFVHVRVKPHCSITKSLYDRTPRSRLHAGTTTAIPPAVHRFTRCTWRPQYRIVRHSHQVHAQPKTRRRINPALSLSL